MSKQNKPGIQNRFLLFTIIVFVSAVTIITLFIQSIRVMKSHDKNITTVDKMIITYESMLKFEQLFLTQYAEDDIFFKSGKNKHTKNHELASKEFNNTMLELDFDKDKYTELNEYLAKLSSINSKYLEVFKQIAEKLYLKGSKSTGKIGELNQNASIALKLSNSAYLTNLINKLNESLKDYLLHKKTKHYTDFVESFRKIGAFLEGTSEVTTEVISVDDSTFIDNTGIDNIKLIEELNNYKTNFGKLIKLEQDVIGLNTSEGLRKSLKEEGDKFAPELKALRAKLQTIKSEYENKTVWILVGICSVLFIIMISYSLFFSRTTISSLKTLYNYLHPLSKGILPGKLLVLKHNNELQKMIDSVNELIVGLKNTTSFAEKIGKGTLGTKFEPLSKQDALGNSLIEMRKNLIIAQEEEKKRQEEDNLRKWSNEGLAEFNEILRQSAGDIDALTLSIVRNITKFLKANQAGLFLINDTKKEDIHLELIATYAYDHERKKQKKIYLGEGLVGMCAVEKSTVYLEDIPHGYLSITSGLGGSSPRSLLIVPLKLEEEIFGVMEIASFNKFRKHEIEFVERVTESISSTLSLAKINTRTAMLLEKSQRQAEEMAAQEEEMRQNFEELQATQEESARREAEMSSILQAINNSSLVVEFDLNGYIINANDAILDLLGLEASDLLGKHQGDFEKMDESSIRSEEFWERLRSGEIISEGHKITVGGKTRWLHEVYTPILNTEGEPYKILNLATDITESKKLEQELLEKAETMSIQEEELRKNLIELEQTQREMHEKQDELEKANEKIKANEKFLHDSIELAKEGERRLKARNAELAEQEVGYQKRIQELELEAKKFKMLYEDSEAEAKKHTTGEKTLKKFLKEAKDNVKVLEDKLKESQQTSERLQEEVDILIEEIERLKGES